MNVQLTAKKDRKIAGLGFLVAKKADPDELEDTQKKTKQVVFPNKPGYFNFLMF